MQFQTIKITGGQADTVDPRASPAAVPAALIKATPATVTNTDKNPANVLLTLEGTAAQTVTVQQWALDEGQVDPSLADNPTAGDAARKFYKFGAAQVVTVGTIVAITALPGRVYFQLTSAPAADAVLKIGYS